LIGIVEGVSVDKIVNDDELELLVRWVEAHKPYWDRHPFNELLPVLAEALADGVLSQEERRDILWLCERLRSTSYYDMVTADIQRLHAIMGAIVADGVITAEELGGLSEWLREHDHLRRCWPYDEVDSVVTAVLADGKVDRKEHEFLVGFFGEFAPLGETQTIACPPVSSGATTQGLCAVCPEIDFDGSLFCFTGASSKYTRRQFSDIVVDLGGRVSNSITPSLDYLVIGADGNPCWAYACYGRKVEKAVELRRQGHRIMLVHENDFHDSVEDVRSG
jgi:hypothetical protein